jgi:unsaturated chondroitin disaccharide hydrolase
VAAHPVRRPAPLNAPPPVTLPEDWERLLDRAWDTARDKVTGLLTRHPDRFPLYSTDGRWDVEGEPWTSWCEGFVGGQLWLLAGHFADPVLRGRAEHYSRLIEHRTDDRDVHDLGFLFWSTYRRWFEATGDPALDDVVVRAGRTLALRFREQGRYLRSFLAADSLFIDIMMNVGVIFHAAQRTGDTELARIATEHCLTSRRVLVRGDGSVAHEGLFDLGTGRFLRQTTQQGWRDDGSWARGLAWSLHGFGTAYRFTGDLRFLETARLNADFYLERTGGALVPPNDWEDPAPDPRYESSAAAVAAGGLWQLACLVGDRSQASRYAQYAVDVLARLCQPDFLACDDPDWEGVIKHGVYHPSKGLGVDESVMWGDYWFLDAVDLLGAAAGA